MNNTMMFPAQHTTTTTTSETQVNPIIRFDRSYLYTINGQLKLVEIISSCIALLFVSFSVQTLYYSTCVLFETIAVTAVWWSTILLVFYLFHVVEKFYRIPWLKLEIIMCIIFTALYFLTTLLALTNLLVSFVFFFFLTAASAGLTIIFGYDAYLKLQSLQAGEIAQGVRVVNHVVEVEPPYRY